MTNAAPHTSRPAVPASGNPAPCIHEIELWLAETAPVVRALAADAARTSIGRRRWLAAQARRGAEALCFLECEIDEAEALDAPTADLEWLHTRVAAMVEAVAPVAAGDPLPEPAAA